LDRALRLFLYLEVFFSHSYKGNQRYIHSMAVLIIQALS